jgi:hypothetical protein
MRHPLDWQDERFYDMDVSVCVMPFPPFLMR